MFFYDAEHPPIEVRADTRQEAISNAEDETGVLSANAELVQEDIFDWLTADTPEGEKFAEGLRKDVETVEVVER